MNEKPTLGELLLGIEGLALLRPAFGDDAETRRARVREIRDLLRGGGSGFEDGPATLGVAILERHQATSAGCLLAGAMHSGVPIAA